MMFALRLPVMLNSKDDECVMQEISVDDSSSVLFNNDGLDRRRLQLKERVEN